MKKEKFDKQLLSQLNLYKQENCIYRERKLFIHSQLHNLEFSQQQVRITLKDLKSPGFTGEFRHHPESDFWNICANWEFFHFSEKKWGATYAGWTLFFDPEFIRAVCKYANYIKDWEPEKRHLAFLKCFHNLQYRKSFLYIKK